ncbi:flagellar hook-basal body complex protein [Xylophilus rhododendri]|uniref:Flagellar hook protein FlgE n=1 Tax=Xylophilus rhododendri TaxID=2697032 RepID=A0A857J5B1_9BURK|nr:flagellar hook-basal body complex protein [Xylophilus rhododendri]QHI99160.1 flagellar hook-basal body complex protein [Xylophilus rhododendri]
MIDSIFVAQTGLRGYEQGLRTISHNTANLNTPGFRSSTTVFADMLAPHGTAAAGGSTASTAGLGLRTVGTRLQLSAGELQSTGNSLDLAVDGQGFFVVRDAAGQLRYTRDGQFRFDDSGSLVNGSGEKVMAFDASGVLGEVSLATLRASPAQATANVTFAGNLLSTSTGASVSAIEVIDSAGSTHTLSLALAPQTGSPGSWTATLSEGGNTVGTATLSFTDGLPSGTTRLAYAYSPAGASAMALTLDFSSGVSSNNTGTSSTVAVSGQDGHGAGTLVGESFDSAGVLQLVYSNGQTVKGRQLAVATFDSVDDIEALGNNEYGARPGSHWRLGVAGGGGFGSVQSGAVEMSNVDLSQEFSNLVIMQRGYQACSQIVSTAGEMIGSLFGMMGA